LNIGYTLEVDILCHFLRIHFGPYGWNIEADVHIKLAELATNFRGDRRVTSMEYNPDTNKSMNEFLESGVEVGKSEGDRELLKTRRKTH
jgi:hypothetical protein